MPHDSGAVRGFAHDAEVWPDPSFPEGGPIRGRDRIRGFYSRLIEDPGTTVTMRDAQAVGDNVLVSFEWHAVGEASGIETSSTWYSVSTFRGDEVVRTQFFADREAARKAAGLQ